jgi:hypothetical protein
MKNHTRSTYLLLGAFLAMPLVGAANPLLDGYLSTAKQESATFAGFSTAAGQKLYNAEGPKQLSCASCHTASPKNPGKHAKTNKDIEPLAPSANAKRFTDAAQVEKWFKRNCNDVLGARLHGAGKR